MTTADDERAARLQRQADAHRVRQMELRREQQAEREREQAEQLTRLVPEPRHEADDPETQARRPAKGDRPATATPRRTVRQPVTAACCPDCYIPLPRAPRLGADGRCQQCRETPNRKTHRQRYDALTADVPD